MRRWSLITLLAADQLLFFIVLVFGVRSYWVVDSVMWYRSVPGFSGYQGETGSPNICVVFASRAGRIDVEQSVVVDGDIMIGPPRSVGVSYGHEFYGSYVHDNPLPQFYLLWSGSLFVLMIPYWFLLLVLALPLVVCVARHVRRRLRCVPAGFCTSCGYDLRASPARCPECGEPIAHSPPGT